MVCVCLVLFYITILPWNNSYKPFASAHWPQKELLGCVVYSHCLTKDTHTTIVYIASAYLEIMLQNPLACCRG